MNLYDKIKAITESLENGEAGILAAEACETELRSWYGTQDNPDYRLVKLLKNLIFYLKATPSDFPFHRSILAAIGKTLLRTADYDLNIRDDPDKVSKRNDDILKLCGKLRREEKEPLEELSDKPYDITIFMATYNQLELTKLCLDSIFRNTTDVSYELYLIDNGSSDGTYEYFKNDNRIKLIRLEENAGLLLALHIFYESDLDNGKFWLYMNNDIVVTPRWASNMLTCIISDPRIASVIPATNRSAQFACISAPLDLYDINGIEGFGERYNVSNPNYWQDWLISYGFIVLLRPEVRRKFGYYEDCFYFPFYFADGDISLSQTLAGYKTVQARDTYVHHFDGGHTEVGKRLMSLAEGEKNFYDKYGFFSRDIEKTLPSGIIVGFTLAMGGGIIYHSMGSTGGHAARVLFLGSARLHPLLQLQSLNKILENTNTEYYAADTMEYLKLEQFGEGVQFQQISNWYELEDVFNKVSFDVIVLMDETVAQLRHPDRFLKAVCKRLSVNGRFYFFSRNPVNLKDLNSAFFSRAGSPRDLCRIRKISIFSENKETALLEQAGFVIDAVESVNYNEAFAFTNLDAIEYYRKLYSEDDWDKAKRNINTQFRIVTARKPSRVDTEKTLEQVIKELM